MPHRTTVIGVKQLSVVAGDDGCWVRHVLPSAMMGGNRVNKGDCISVGSF